MTTLAPKSTRNTICVEAGEFTNSVRTFGEDNAYCAVWVHLPPAAGANYGWQPCALTVNQLLVGIERGRKQCEMPARAGYFARLWAALLGRP